MPAPPQKGIVFSHSGVTGQTLRVSIQKMENNGTLGDWWKASTAEWVTGADTFANRSASVSEGAAELAGDYSTALEIDDYTGYVVKRYHDTVASNATIQREIARVVGGQEQIQLATAQQRVNQWIPKIFTWSMSRRTDGTIAATNVIRISEGDVVAVAFDTSRLYAHAHVVSVGEPTITGSGLDAIAAGPRDAQAVLSLLGGQVEGTTYVIDCVVTMDNGDVLKLTGSVKCVAA